VVADSNMPFMDGFELARKIRAEAGVSTNHSDADPVGTTGTPGGAGSPVSRVTFPSL
jgi:CheY-like chemotaxis protein